MRHLVNINSATVIAYPHNTYFMLSQKFHLWRQFLILFIFFILQKKYFVKGQNMQNLYNYYKLAGGWPLPTNLRDVFGPICPPLPPSLNQWAFEITYYVLTKCMCLYIYNIMCMNGVLKYVCSILLLLRVLEITFGISTYKTMYGSNSNISHTFYVFQPYWFLIYMTSLS